MATNDSDTSQGQQKVVLKRKLTGPPRLLLGKAKATNQTGGRPDVRVLRHQRRMDSNGASKDSTPPTHNVTLGEDGMPSVRLPGSPQAAPNVDSHQTRLEHDFSACEVCCEDKKAKDQNLDAGTRKKKNKTTKERQGLRRLLPHLFMCVRWRQKKDGPLEAKKGDIVTAQTLECTGEDSQATGGNITHGNTKQDVKRDPASDANMQDGTVTGAGKGRNKNIWFPLVGRHKSKCRQQSKPCQSLTKDSGAQKKTFRKRIQGFLTRRRKEVSSKLVEGGDAQRPLPEETAREVDSHDDDIKDPSKTPKEGGSDREGELVSCPETVTVNAEVTADSENGTECECQDGDAGGDPTCKMSEDSNTKYQDGEKQQSCVDVQVSDGKDASGFNTVSNSTCVAELTPGPQIDIALAMDDVFENGAEDAELFDHTSETTGPDHGVRIRPRYDATNMSFLTVPGDAFWAPRKVNSPGVKSCANTFDCGLAPGDASLLTDESLLILTANSLVQAAIKSALCQLSREVQPPLTNSHRDTGCANMEGS